jgi:hypothetical protein
VPLVPRLRVSECCLRIGPQLLKALERRGGGKRREELVARRAPMGLNGWIRRRMELLEVTESKMCNLELRVCEIEGTWWIESKC